MFFLLLLFYIINITLIFFDVHFLFVNEEFLIFLCIVALFILLFSVLRRTVNFIFFLKIEQIYFFFLYLLLLNEQLVIRVLGLLKLYSLKLNLIFSVELSNLFLKVMKSFLSINIFYNFVMIGNFVSLVNINSILLKYLSKASSFNFCVRNDNNKSLVQILDINSISSDFFLIRNVSDLPEFALFKQLMNSVLYGIFHNSLKNDLFELSEIDFIVVLDLFILLFNAKLIENFRKFLVFFKC